ncbi:MULTISPECIES: lysozyme inhibitor LprI family protein [Phenylobacterium]|uniref:Uncharacterized protein YecT (DUF1311 family) n=1 Tax=Phenylobacterium koreense TaxID=266125 RepID=A0ABV2EHV9_9CAUL
MRPMILAAGAALSWAMAAPGLADPAYDACIGASNDNASWSRCGADLIKREDDRLNATWKKVYGLTSGRTRTDLLAEQRAWISFKDKACRFYANGDQGREGQVLSYPMCQAQVIGDRTRQLEAIGSQIGPR